MYCYTGTILCSSLFSADGMCVCVCVCVCVRGGKGRRENGREGERG